MSALVLSSMMFVSCDDPNKGGNGDGPIVEVEKEYPVLEAVAGKVVIAAKFEGEICNDIALVGSYNGWNEDPALMLKFEPIGDEWENWYKVEVDTTAAGAGMSGPAGAETPHLMQLKPVQLKMDGTFDWQFQVGDSASVTVYEGDVYVKAGFAGECDLFFKSTEPVVLKFAGWKADNSPCVIKDTKDYTFIATVPAATPADAVIRVVGGFGHAGFPDWATDGAGMEMTKQDNGTYTLTLANVEVGTNYKYVINGTWDGEELAAFEDGAECAKGIDNRATGEEATINDTVENWAGVTTTRCE